MRRKLLLGIALASGAVGACVRRGPPTPPAPSLVGAWEQEGAAAHAGADTSARQGFVFRDDGSAFWIFTTAARRDSFAIRYHLDAGATPPRLDLSGFERGPLRGRTLLCIVDLSAAGRFRMDCEPGSATRPPEEVRPASFTAQTVLYRRTAAR